METPAFKLFPDMDLDTYYKTISAMGKKVMRERRAKGETMHLAPLGYKNARDQQGRSVTVIDPKTYPLVLEARRIRCEGMPIRKICQALTAKGLRTKHGNVIGPSGMLRVLSGSTEV